MFNKFVYYLKFLLCVIGETFFLTLTIPLMLLRWRDTRNGILAGHCILKFCEILGVTFEIEGTRFINKHEPIIFVINHQCGLDAIAIKKILIASGNFAGLMKTSLIANLPYGLAAYLCDSIFVSRSKAKGMFSTSHVISRCIDLLTVKKRNILIFPEGTRSSGDDLLPFKRGAFNIAIKTGVKVQPIIIQNYKFIDHERKIFGRGEVKLRVLAPLEVIVNETADEFRERCYKIMNNEFHLINM